MMNQTTPPWKNIGETVAQTLDYDELTHCMRCGFCLPACPTYRETGEEAASPRGRIALMKAVSDHWITPDQDWVDQMHLCLGCRACEPACPAGVQFGRLLEQARSGITDHLPQSPFSRFLSQLFFQKLFPYPRRMQIIGGMIAFYQRSGLRWLAHSLQLTRLLPKMIRNMEQILPPASPRGVRHQLGASLSPEETPKGRVGLFRGCIMDILFTKTNRNTARLLAKAGYEVVIPEEQTCCGALHAHAGEEAWATRLAERNIRAFQDAGIDWIATNAGGCGAMLSEYPHLLRKEPSIAKDAAQFAASVRDVSQLLLQSENNLSFGPIFKRITYQDSCHLRNGMGVFQEPRQLIRSIPGITWVELGEAERCCGSAGIYNLTHPDLSLRLLDEKMKHVQDTKADLLVTTNPGCLLQMKLGIQRAGLENQMRVLHLVDLLAEAMEQEKGVGPP